MSAVGLWISFSACSVSAPVIESPNTDDVVVTCDPGMVGHGAGSCEPFPEASNGTPCNEASTCVWSESREEVECSCAVGWKGDECEDLAVCELKPCGDHGDCDPLDGLGGVVACGQHPGP